MNYKSLIKSRKMRVAIMRFFSFLPDSFVVRVQYKLKTGRKLHLKEPKRFTEKLQWYKLRYRDPLMQKCADKFFVRQYVKEIGYEDTLIPLLGVYDTIDSVDFSSLPNSFVLKDTLGCGGSSVIIVRNKKEADIEEIKKTVKSWPNTNRGKHPGREWVYDNQKPKLLIEEPIDSGDEEFGLVDYKFHCFNGEVAYVYVICDRNLGNGAALGIFNKDFQRMPVSRRDERPLLKEIKKPDNYAEMVACAEKLSSPFPHARIDLYNQKGKIYFGEITFFDGSGYMSFEPDSFDYVLGEKFVLPSAESK